MRATSALLSVLTMVRPFSRALLSPLGASKSDNATVEAWTEVGFELPDGVTVRPDGVLRCVKGKKEFAAVLETKVGDAKLDLGQIDAYLALCRQEGFDCLITVSGEVAPFDGAHPTPGADTLAKQRKVPLHHRSWARLLSAAARQCLHSGVDDPEQAWVLAEFVRYLEHPAAGASAPADMGDHWASVRDAARDSLLAKSTPGVEDVCRRWDQMLQSIALRLSAELGCDVQERVQRAHRADPALRLREAVHQACGDGTLTGTLRVPDAISDMDVTVDLRASRTMVSADFAAPTDKGARGRVSWLLKQLRHAPETLTVEASPHKSKSPEIAALSDVRADPTVLVRSADKPPARFRVVQRSEMGRGRRTVRKLGFADSVAAAVDEFYSDVLQHMKKAVPAAPRKPEPSLNEDGPATWPWQTSEERPA